MNLEMLMYTGEMAKVHGINKKTLIYYDEIGLFHPYYRDEKGYRYYNFTQHSALEIILSLREMGVPIVEIKDYIEKRTPEHLMTLLVEKEKAVRNQIKALQSIQGLLNNKIQSMNQFERAHRITFVESKEERLFIIPASERMSDEVLTKRVAEATAKFETRLYSKGLGSMMLLNDLLNHKFEAYSFLYMKHSEMMGDEHLFIKPQGKYLQIYYEGNWSDMGSIYEEVLEYVEMNDLSLKGYVYEESIIDDFASKDPDLYVTKIMIAIE